MAQLGGHTATANAVEENVERDECGCRKHPRKGSLEWYLCTADIIRIPKVQPDLAVMIQASVLVVTTLISVVLFIVGLAMPTWITVDNRKSIKMGDKSYTLEDSGSIGLWDVCKADGDCTTFEDAFGSATPGIDGTRSTLILAIIAGAISIGLSAYLTLAVMNSISMTVLVKRRFALYVLAAITATTVFALVSVSIFAGDLDIRKAIHDSNLVHLGPGFSTSFTGTIFIMLAAVMSVLVWSLV